MPIAAQTSGFETYWPDSVKTGSEILSAKKKPGNKTGRKKKMKIKKKC